MSCVPLLFGTRFAPGKPAIRAEWVELRAASKAGIVWPMAATRHKIRTEDEQGLKYFKALLGLIERLHFVGTERDKAGNRDLHMDQYCMLILLSTGRQPTKRTFEMVCFYLSGWASPEELERHIESFPQPV